MQHRNKVAALDGIRSAEEFRAILDRERTRVNRNGHEFSLVVFDLANVSYNGTYARYLAKVLSQRVRSTDEIGWFAEHRLAVALPYTASTGALKVAADVRKMISTRALSPNYTIYTYPSRWVTNTDDDPDQKHGFNEILG